MLMVGYRSQAPVFLGSITTSPNGRFGDSDDCI